MEAKVRIKKTYDLLGLTESQADDLLYFVAKIPGTDIPRNGRQSELLDTIRQALLSSGLTLKDPN